MFDERYSVAEEAIYDAFFLLLKEKPLDKITVSDVIKKAGIVRSTFYNHYENIPCLVTAIEDKTIDDIFHLMESFHPKNDREICKTYFLTLCEYTRNNPFLAELLRSGGSNIFFEKSLMMLQRYVSEIARNYSSLTIDRETFAYVTAGTIGSVIGMLHKWTNEDFRMTEDTIAEILTQNFIACMMPYIS